MKAVIQSLEKLQDRCQVHSEWQAVAMLLVLSLTGCTVVPIRPLLFHWVGISAETSRLTLWMWYIGCIVPTYQLLLLGYGWLFGQYRFFIRRYQKMISARFAAHVPRSLTPSVILKKLFNS